jgi:hypothetical protein
LYISSWGTKGPPSRWAAETRKKNPADDVQNYIPPPQPVDARINVDGTVLVSGLVKSPERTDQTMFDLINSEVSAFEYQKIVAFCDDVKFSKKRLLSRSARYTGLLDKLEFVQASLPGALPTTEQLSGVKGWVAYLEGDDLVQQVKQVASTAQEATDVENVAILLVGANELDPSAAQEAVKALEQAAEARDGKLQYTLVAVGQLVDTAEGKVPYKYAEFTSPEGVIPKDAVFSRDEALRMITELLQLDAGINRTLSFMEVHDKDAPEYKLIKGLRAAGYPRPTEVDFMINSGVHDYAKAIEEWKESDGAATSDNWWEDERFQEIIKEREAERKSVYSTNDDSSAVAEIKDAKTVEIETIAKEWAKREYFRKSMEGGVGELTEEEFIESVWDRAMFEGDLKYRQLHGEVTDEKSELQGFKERQAMKKKAMLARAKAELAQVLEEEDLGGKDLEEKLSKLEASDDNTDA